MIGTDLAVEQQPSHAEVARLLDIAAGAADRAISTRTRREYERDWRTFTDTVRGVDLQSCATSTATALVLAHLGRLAERGAKASTLDRACAGIRWGLLEHAGRTDEATKDPRVGRALQGWRRDPERRPHGARAVLAADVRTLVDHAACARDRAIILTLYATAMRRDELARLTCADVVDDGTVILFHLGQSKTDQEGRGRTVAVHPGEHAATCPVRAIRAWLVERESVPPANARLFGLTSTEAIRLIVARTAARAGLEGVSPHGFRAGHVTQARMNGASNGQIRRSTGHSSDRMLDRYTRAVDALDNSARMLGL